MEGELELDEVPARLAVNAESLRRYLAARLPGFSCEARALRVRQFSHGESNPTYHLLASGAQEYVMRRRPPGNLLPGAHRVSEEGGREGGRGEGRQGKGWSSVAESPQLFRRQTGCP